jgi:phosphatidylserine/phosphatidylglycerophosphate/cardiolipin synthase-like enzyme
MALTDESALEAGQNDSQDETQAQTDSTDDVLRKKIYFTSPSRPHDGTATGGIESNLIALIDAAQTSIDLAVFEFDLHEVAQALIRAKDRGVEVRVVHDNEYTSGDPQIGWLEEAGIPVVADNRSALMHNKFFVIDSRCVWTGSFNVTENAAYKNNENAIIICHPKLAENYGVEFQEMFEGKFGITSPSDTPHPVIEIDGIKVENYFAPEDDVMAKVIDVVSRSEKTVNFMVFSFTDDDLGREMILLMEKGVEVSGIFEQRGAGTQSSECTNLLLAGANVRLDGNPYTFHHKVIIVDGKVVIFGSVNFSNNANKRNDENLLIIHSQNLATQFQQEFERRMEESLPTQPDKCVRK